MDEKSETPPAPAAEPEKDPALTPVRLARLAMVRVTPEELARRQKADEEAQRAKAEARRPKTPPAGVAPASSAPAPVPSGPDLVVDVVDLEEPLLEATVEPADPPPPAPPLPAPAVASATSRVPARLLDAALGFLGSEGKQVPALAKLATRVAQRLGVAGPGLEKVGTAVQALFVASQLDRRGAFDLPEMLAVQKLLGSSYEELAELLAPCLKGALGKASLECADAAALAATLYFFNHARTTAPAPQLAKTALGTLKSQRWIPAAALDALAAELAG